MSNIYYNCDFVYFNCAYSKQPDISYRFLLNYAVLGSFLFRIVLNKTFALS